jgi:hypothetical protein
MALESVISEAYTIKKFASSNCIITPKYLPVHYHPTTHFMTLWGMQRKLTTRDMALLKEDPATWN